MNDRRGSGAWRQEFEAEALAGLFAGLESRGVRYAVLRNHEALPRSVGARDIDVVVMPEDLQAAMEAVCALASDMGLLYANYYRDERLTQFAIVRRAGSGDVLDLKIDFFTNSQIYGIEAFRAQEMLADVRIHHGIPVVDEKYVFLDKWLFHVLVGQPLHPKYDQTFAEICRRERESVLMLLAPLLDAHLARDLIAGVASGSASTMRQLSRRQRLVFLARMFVRNGPRGIGHGARFLMHRLHNLMRPQGIFVSLSGPDGCGKTTVIDAVIAQLKTTFGSDSVVYQHFRPAALPRIADVAKAAHAIEKVDADYANPHRAKPSGPLGSLLRLGYYYADYVFGYFRSIRPVLIRRQVALFDRYYYDMMCDPGRSRISLPFWILCLAGRLLPLPAYAFFIHVEADEVYRRKKELSLERITELNGRYLGLVRRGLLRQVDNGRSSEEAAREIVDTIIQDRDAKARRLLARVLA